MMRACLQTVEAQLSWTSRRYWLATDDEVSIKAKAASEFDLDLSVFLLTWNESTKKYGARSTRDLIFYNSLPWQSHETSGAIDHDGDDLDVGSSTVSMSAQKTEKISISFNELGDDYAILAIVVSIYDAIPRKQCFGQIPFSCLTLALRFEDTDETHKVPLTNEEIWSKTAVIPVTFLRKSSGWVWDQDNRSLLASHLIDSSNSCRGDGLSELAQHFLDVTI